VASLSTPGRGSKTFVYDAMGSVLSQSDARGITVRNEYDALNRTIGTWEDGDKAGTFIGRAYDVTEECDSVECGYAVGKQVATSYPLGDGDVGLERFGYNARGEAVMFGRTLGGNEVVFRSGYDNVGRVKDVDYGGIESVAYEYDGLSRITSVPGYVDDVDHTPRGLLGGMHYANGTMSQYRYDKNMALTGLLSEDTDGESFQDLHYTRNRVGHVVGVDDRRLANDGPSGSALYEHDSLYRLREADLDSASNAWHETMSYTYDRTSRLLKKISSLAGSAANVGVYDYAGKAQGLHAVTSTKLGDTTTTYDYDASGNMVRRGTDTLQWDGMGRLVSVRDDAGHETQMVYGAQQDRVIKRASGHVDYYFHEDFVVRDGVATIYVRVGDKRIAKIENIDTQSVFMGDWSPGTDDLGKYRVQSDGVLSAADGWAVWALEKGTLVTDGQAPAYDADEVLAAAAKRLVLVEDWAVSFLYANHLGSNTASTNAAGKVVQSSSFYPFGQLRHASHGFTEDYGFTGKETDNSTGLSYFGFRYLDPHLGRWISMDPLTLGFTAKSVATFEPGQVGELHTFYQYSGNSPINFVDHEGLEKLSLTLDDDVRGGVTFVNDDPNNPSPDQEVKAVVADFANLIGRTLGSVNINSTTGGHEEGPHVQKRAFDINRVGQIGVTPLTAEHASPLIDAAAKLFSAQNPGHLVTHIGPSGITQHLNGKKRGGPFFGSALNTPTKAATVVRGHQDHHHLSIYICGAKMCD
jgi:RHS repeat-associated protein